MTRKTHKRGNGEGSIYFDSSTGRYRAAVTLPDGRRVRVSGETRKAAANKLTELQSQQVAGVPVGSADRVGPFCGWWLTTLEAKAASGERSVRTADHATWAVRSWITPHLGGKRLRELEPEDVERMLSAIVAAGLSRESVKKIRMWLGKALDVAMRRGRVSRNVARIAEVPATKPPRERRSLTPDEAKAVLAAARGNRLEALFVTALMLGLRPGELCGLRWQDIDLAAGTLRVAVSLKSERGQLRLGDPKTPRSTRTVNLPAPVLSVLRAHEARQKREQLRAGGAWGRLGLVFTTEIGGPIDNRRLHRVTREVTTRAEVPAVSPNEFSRHTAASFLYDAGVPLDHIADLLGHTSTKMLEQHYRHRVRPSMDMHVGPMEQLFAPVAPAVAPSGG